MVGGETFDLTLRFLDDPGGPILAGAEDDARMRREPRPLRRGQKVRTGLDGFRAGRGKQSDAKECEGENRTQQHVRRKDLNASAAFVGPGPPEPKAVTLAQSNGKHTLPPFGAEGG